MIPKQYHAKHPEAMHKTFANTDFQSVISADIYSMAFTFFPELRKIPFLNIYAGLVQGPTGKHILNIEDDIIPTYIKKHYRFGMNILFDNTWEGNVDVMVNKIHKIAEQTEIDPSKFYYLCAAADINKQYEDFCIRSNIEGRINLLNANSWEFAVKKNFNLTPTYSVKEKSKIFLCFNRVIRNHRIGLMSLLSEADLIDKSFFSFFPEAQHGSGIENQIEKSFEGFPLFLSEHTIERIKNGYKKQEKNLPLKLNIDWTFNKTGLDYDDVPYFEESYFSLVTETFFFEWFWEPNVLDHRAIFFSEKTFKPIAMKHPFILAARPYSLKSLREMGYKTFHPYIDETYDTIENNEARLLAITNEVKRLSSLKSNEWLEWQEIMSPIVEHNFDIFTNRKDYTFRGQK
jgi:hypothetical protein